jgi:hypothetical protein
MIPEVHLSVRIALFQVFTVIIGVFMTRAAFMASGYPDADLQWNRLALLLRNHGYFLLLVPLAWTLTATRLENLSSGPWSRRWTLVTGMLVLAALAGLLLWSFSNPYASHRLHLRPMSE